MASNIRTRKTANQQSGQKQAEPLIKTKPGLEGRKRPVIFDIGWVVKGLVLGYISQDYLDHALFVLDPRLDDPKRFITEEHRVYALDIVIANLPYTQYQQVMLLVIETMERAEQEQRVAWIRWIDRLEGFQVMLQRLGLPPLQSRPWSWDLWDELLEREGIPLEVFSKQTAW